MYRDLYQFNCARALFWSKPFEHAVNIIECWEAIRRRFNNCRKLVGWSCNKAANISKENTKSNVENLVRDVNQWESLKTSYIRAFQFYDRWSSLKKRFVSKRSWREMNFLQAEQQENRWTLNWRCRKYFFLRVSFKRNWRFSWLMKIHCLCQCLATWH